MSFTSFLKSKNINLAFNQDPEASITSYQDIFNELLLKNIYLIDEHFEQLIDGEGCHKDILPLMSSLKTLYDIWQSITAAENVVDVNRAFDVMTKEGFNLALDKIKLERIQSAMINQDNN